MERVREICVGRWRHTSILCSIMLKKCILNTYIVASSSNSEMRSDSADFERFEYSRRTPELNSTRRDLKWVLIIAGCCASLGIPLMVYLGYELSILEPTNEETPLAKLKENFIRLLGKVL
eukprot:TRINITY_DN2173_c0_g1_i10.p1 TRINITY_DN2173_c0_g1~~TRINITY_DN2173_c0_g1_i10.p1  ORF type:complete len:120 (-),score=0.47 TRINITY_DN2173_c0_g1_i10:144-503(-)